MQFLWRCYYMDFTEESLIQKTLVLPQKYYTSMRIRNSDNTLIFKERKRSMSDNKKNDKGQDRRGTQDSAYKPCKDSPQKVNKVDKNAQYDTLPPPNKKPKK